MSDATENLTPITYKDAGVDIDAGDEAVERYKTHARATQGPEVMSGIGGFAALFRPDLAGMREPVLVSCTDGVGTKLAVAHMADRHDTVGIDLVAMNANDLICCGARPLFFLDYYACGVLEPKAAEQVIAGIAEGCRQANMALIGGETAEMPGFYPKGVYDLAGFAVGLVDRPAMLGPTRVRAGQKLIGLTSSGVHSNGYSLARKVIFDRMRLTVKNKVPEFGDKTVGDVLLEPTRIYVRALEAVQAACPGAVAAAAHITGGGIPGNLPRVLPENIAAKLDITAWELPAVFRVLEKAGQVPRADMWRTFNMGIGFFIAVEADHAQAALSAAFTAGYEASIVGELVERVPGGEQVLGLDG